MTLAGENLAGKEVVVRYYEGHEGEGKGVGSAGEEDVVGWGNSDGYGLGEGQCCKRGSARRYLRAR